jgi:argininosuccinate synthase
VTQRPVTGTVRVCLYKGTATVVGRDSPHSLYSAEHATFGADGIFDQADARGFIRLFGLPIAIAARARSGSRTLMEVA